MQKIIPAGQRKIYDDWHWSQIQTIENLIDQKFETSSFYYTDGGMISAESIEMYAKDPNRVIVIMTCDYHPWNKNDIGCKISMDDILKQLANIKKTFILLTSMTGLEKDFCIPANVHCVPHGSDIVLQQKSYPLLHPVREKNLNTDRHFISLSLNPRSHRLLAAMICLGHELGYDEGIDPPTGLLRISAYPLDAYSCWQDYYPDLTIEIEQQKILDIGFQRLKENMHGGQPAGNIYEHLNYTDNATNFDRSLRFMYANSLVEIINGTLFHNRAIIANEKFLNSIYGFNLPIFISTPGTVRHFENLGFDMFRDIVDQSYDDILDPTQRVFAAIERNIDLLSNKSLAIQRWHEALPRLENNFVFASRHMYDQATLDFESRLMDCINNL